MTDQENKNGITIRNSLHFDEPTCDECELYQLLHLPEYTLCPSRGNPYSLLCPAWEKVSFWKAREQEQEQS